MCSFTPSGVIKETATAVFHVSPDCDPETKKALTELAQCSARSVGHDGPIEVGFVPWCGVDDDYVEVSDNAEDFDA